MTENGGQFSDPSVEFIRLDTFTQAIGFSVYAFEGIGIVIPIYEIAEDKEGFLKIVYLVFLTVCSLYVVFGLICIEAFGPALSLPLITSVALP
jgi:amino acid permease